MIKINPKNHIQIQNKLDSNQEQIPKEYKKIARAMETQFAKMMIEQMKKTVDKSSTQNSATKYYESLSDHEKAKLMSSGNGLGIQKMILDQIYPKHLRNKGNIKMYKNANEQVSHKENKNGIN